MCKNQDLSQVSLTRKETRFLEDSNQMHGNLHFHQTSWDALSDREHTRKPDTHREHISDVYQIQTFTYHLEKYL